jgi:hypothetical protein
MGQISNSAVRTGLISSQLGLGTIWGGQHGRAAD